jgi:HEXXH motif-containing protein
MLEMPCGLLSVPKEGDKTLARAVRKARLVALRRLLGQAPQGLSPHLSASLQQLQSVLYSLLRTKPQFVLDAVGSPDVLPILLTLEVGLGEPEPLLREAVPSLLAGLTHYPDKTLLREHLLWDVSVTKIVDGRGHRVFQFDPPAKGLLADVTGLEVALGEQQEKLPLPRAPGAVTDREEMKTERPFYPLRKDLPRLHLSEVDSNPLSMFEAHPDKEGNAIDLGGYPVSEWQSSLGEAFDLIQMTLPSWYSEIPVALERIVPVGYLPEAHLSASYREAPGTVYMTLHPNKVTLAEALIHETQHGKANALSWSDPLLYNAHTEWTESAVRPDLRPLWGVLLAVHAFVPVAAMHYVLAEKDHPLAKGEWFGRRRAQVLKGNANGIVTLKEKSDPSPLGSEMLQALYDLNAFLQEVAPPSPVEIPEDQMPPG